MISKGLLIFLLLLYCYYYFYASSSSSPGPGRFGRQVSVTDIYHTIPYPKHKMNHIHEK